VWRRRFSQAESLRFFVLLAKSAVARSRCVLCDVSVLRAGGHLGGGEESRRGCLGYPRNFLTGFEYFRIAGHRFLTAG
jgi:hypothetical protein